MRCAHPPRMIRVMPDSRRVAAAALLLLPAALLGYLAFNAGGFYPAAPAYAAMVLCAVFVLRMTLAEDPLAGTGRWLALPGAALALFSLLTLTSQAWSHAPGVALTEFDLPLLYLLVLLLFGSLARSPNRLAWLLRALAGAVVVVCACGVATRLAPDLWPTPPELANNRLSFPITYWNALGLVAAMGIVLCVHLASDLAERIVVRMVAAAAVPLLATTLYFTFSRGAIAVAAIGVVLYAVVGRPRALASAALAIGPATAAAIRWAYDANLLASYDPTSARAVVQGHRVAVALAGSIVGAAALRALAIRLDRRLGRFQPSAHARRVARRAAWAASLTVALLLAVAFNGAIAREYHRFLSPAPLVHGGDLRTRLTDPGNNGRIEMWRVAWHGFESAPLLGHGAGTYADTWAQKRPTGMFVRDAHSLYLETLDELGAVGMALLLVVILVVLVRAAWLARGPRRPVYAAAFALLVAWTIHAGFDWDWEMPAVSVVFFAVGGAVLARAPQPVETSGRQLARFGAQRRVLLGLLFVLVGVAPTYVWLSQRKLNQATAAFDAGDCRLATSAALSSISILGVRAEPYEILAYCDIEHHMPALAVAAIHKAISLDPHNYNYELDLAAIAAAAGLDPRPAASRAHALNPLDPVVLQVWQTFDGAPPSQWQADGERFVAEFNSSI